MSPGEQTQRLQQQRLDATTPPGTLADVRSGALSPTAVSDLARLPVETPCFPIARVALTNNPFPWLATIVRPIVGQCVGKAGLKVVQSALVNALVRRGYVTARVLVPEQSLVSGTLMLGIVAGRVVDIRAKDGSPGRLGGALPTHEGALLNQRDIDQGLENIQRLPSQADTQIEIAPGLAPGDSVLVVSSGTGKRWRGTIGIDNGGQDATGRYQLNGALTIDSPLRLYDQLQISGATNANYGASDKGTRSMSVGYSVPVGYAMLSFAASRSRHLQTVAGFGGVVEYSGAQSRIEGGLSGVVFRDAQARTTLHATLYRALNRNEMDGVDIGVQARDMYGYEVGIAHRQYLARAQIDGTFAWRASLPGISKNSGTVVGDSGFGGRTQIEMASVTATVPFHLDVEPLSYRFAWSMQNALTSLTPPDRFAIGTRYAVRGFDSQRQLAAESGWVVSNEIDWYVPSAVGTQAIYTGVDMGRVRGPSARWLMGDTLAGVVIGARGSLAPKNKFGASLSYDMSLGWPIYKPQGFSTQSPTWLFQVTSLF
ncbi:ShlB/FhaC/HecB family hemolysin secretion/activation protein [Pararobbsia silviterrae]|uniref:ShlB/FhaC/HecB family hemolysin secretion/activation protein n=1 Tax=Pararobbsia silviterrae TaxID=1792498 RepID=A0A494Y3I4_9BURK|nr:ShlB/FhaC/HecB family hemolysin secretion/activation protein [Pararobbsia silviterrae]